MKTPPAKLLVTKASGESEPYQREKILNSLNRVKVPAKFHRQAISFVEDRLYPGIKTAEIFADLKRFLKENHLGSASRYALKRALFDLGPSGHPFEAFVAALFAKLGYRTQLNLLIEGKCVTHEVDVVARQGDRHFIIECKYHHRQGIKSDVKVPLYVWARFEDIVRGWQSEPEHRQEFHQAWVVTNTRATKDAHQFARCRRMRLISWDRPAGEGLRELIGQTGLHPITSLCTLSAAAKRTLIDRGVIDVRKFLSAGKDVLQGIPPRDISQAREEIKLLLE
jgi:Holliday junction resolvase-like predicted endonuclease